MSAQPVDRLLAVIRAGVVPSLELVADEVGFDATVPNRRFTVLGSKAVSDKLAEWFRDPGRFEELRRRLLSDGELIEFTLTWTERGLSYACHQVDVVVADGRIAADTVFCGGRWPASLLTEMAEADLAHR